MGKRHPAAPALEPNICDASAISRQVLELVQSVEVVDWDSCDRLRLGKP